jgi:TCP-1/cpn60 chaperonin family
MNFDMKSLGLVLSALNAAYEDQIVDQEEEQDKDNVLDGDDYRDLYKRTCQTIYNKLAAHCGPYAKNALIIENDSSRINEYNNVFTKDGATIVRSMKFSNPLEEHLKKIVHYVGTRVDNISHDGTTTSMMLFIDLLMKIPALFYDTDMMDKEIVDSISDAVDILTDSLNEMKITVEDIVNDFGIDEKEVKRFIARNQALVASKGNVELAEAIVEIVDHLPVELYGQFNLTHSKLETDKRFTVLYDDFDFYLVATNTNRQKYNNHNLYSEYLNEDCDFLIIIDQLSHNNPVLDVLKKYVTSLTINENTLERDMVIITPVEPSPLTELIEKYNDNHKNKIIIVTATMHINYSSKNTPMSCILASAGQDSIYDRLHLDNFKDIVDQSLIKHAKIHIRDRYAYIYNLYKRDGGLYHPFYNNPDAPEAYKTKIKELRDFLDIYLKGHTPVTTPEREQMLKDGIDLYRRLICQQVVRLEISGSTHDVHADRTVAIDSMGAVLSSIEHGFIVDGFSKLYKTASNITNRGDNREILIVIAKSILAILKIIHRSAEFDIAGIITSPDFEKYSYLMAPAITHGTIIKNGKLGVFSTWFNIENQENMTFNEALAKAELGDYALIQPIDGYLELIKRIKELIPKFANTTCSITAGDLIGT